MVLTNTIELVNDRESLIGSIKQLLVTHKEKLLKKNYLSLTNCDEMTGHCYVASEVFYHLWGKFNGFSPKVVSNKIIEKDTTKQWTHWYLQNRDTLEIIDLTSSQFSKKELEFCYANGKFASFLTGYKPSKRSKFVIDEILKLKGT